jgi:hypothetical protein
MVDLPQPLGPIMALMTARLTVTDAPQITGLAGE